VPKKTTNRGALCTTCFTCFPPVDIFDEFSGLRRIDPGAGSVLSVPMDVDGCQNNSGNAVSYVEHVQCRISLEFFPRGDLRIVLTSPMGTESVLLFERPLDVVSSTFDDWPFLSVHYWGEKIVGRWQLNVTRRMANSTADSPGNSPFFGFCKKKSHANTRSIVVGRAFGRGIVGLEMGKRTKRNSFENIIEFSQPTKI